MLGFLESVSGHWPVGGESAREDGGVLGAVSGESMLALYGYQSVNIDADG